MSFYSPFRVPAIVLGFLLCVITLTPLKAQYFPIYDSFGTTSRILTPGATFDGYVIDLTDSFLFVGNYTDTFDVNGGNATNLAGAVYVHKQLTDGSWQFHQKLVSPNRSVGEHFGSSLERDGNYLVVGTQSLLGGSYVFKHNEATDQWEYLQAVSSSSKGLGSLYGFSVAIEDSIIAVGEPEYLFGTFPSERVFIWRLNGAGNWVEQQAIQGDPNHYFGHAVKMSGDYLLVGAVNDTVDAKAKAGSVSLYKKNAGNTFDFVQEIESPSPVANGHFGTSLAMDGQVAIIGEPNASGGVGAIHFYRLSITGDTLAWIETQVGGSGGGGSPKLGISVDVSGDMAVAGQPNHGVGQGTIYIYDEVSANDWDLRETADIADLERLGNAVSIHGDVVAAKSTFSAHILENCFVSGLPNVSSTDDTVCLGDKDTLFVQSGQLNGAADWYWYADACGGTLLGTGDTLIVEPQQTTTYYVRGGGGCVVTSSCGTHRVVVREVLSATPSLHTICSGDSLTLTASGGINMVWNHGVPNGQPFTADSAGTLRFVVTGQDSTGQCADAEEVSITSRTLPPVSIESSSSTDKICVGESISLSATGASSYSWSDGIIEGVSFSPDTTATYRVTGTDMLSCQAVDSIWIEVLDTPVVTLSAAVLSACGQQEIPLIATGAPLYYWPLISNDTIDSSQVTLASGISLGIKVVGVVSPTCTDEDSVYIEVSRLDTAIKLIDDDSALYLYARDGMVDSFQWIDCEQDTLITGEQSRRLYPSRSGSYAVILEKGACLDTSDCMSVTIVGDDTNTTVIGEFENGQTNGKIMVYPMPVMEHMVAYSGQQGPQQWWVTDLSGRMVIDPVLHRNEMVEMDLSMLAPGSYLLHWRSLSIQGQNQAVSILVR